MILTLGLSLAMVLLLSSPAAAELKIEERDGGKTWFVTIDAFPETLEEFTEFRNEACDTPAGAMVAFIAAMKLYGEDKELGQKCMMLVLDGENLIDGYKVQDSFKEKRGLVEFKGYVIDSRVANMMVSTGFLADRPYAALSYVMGTSADDGYKLPDPPYRFIIEKHRVQDRDPDVFKVKAHCTGASNPPYHLRKNSKGQWKMWKCSSFFAGTKDPPQERDDGL